MKNQAVHIVSVILVVIGGLNLGIEGLFNYDIIGTILGAWPALVRIIGVLIGLAAILLIFTHKKDCKACVGGAPSP